MNISRPFIVRPVATSLLMMGGLLAGAVAYQQLPVSALPQVDYPTIQVVTFYPGASPEVMSSSVTAPHARGPGCCGCRGDQAAGRLPARTLGILGFCDEDWRGAWPRGPLP